MVVAVASAGLGLLAYVTEALRSQELNTVDTRFSIRSEEERPEDIVVVGIDPDTFQELHADFPFSHDHHARVVDRLRRDGAKAIVLDIQFSEPRGTEAQTVALLDAVEAAGNVVASTTEVNDLGNGNAFTYLGVPANVENSSRRGAINDYIEKELRVKIAHGGFPRDPGGVIRRLDAEPEGLKSLDIATAELVRKRPVDRSKLVDGSAWIDFAGRPGKFEHVSYSDVRLGRTKPGKFRDKIVVVGATAPVLQDVQPTSMGGEVEMSGPEIHANGIKTVLDGFPLGESPAGLNIVLVVLMGIAAPALSLRLPAFRALALAVLLGLVYAGVTQVAFNGGTILPFVYPVGALALGTVGALGVYYLTEAIERERTRDMFARFVPESVVGQALEQADGLRLGGVGREATVMFSDLRGFTSFAEQLEPDQVITILNHYLAAMVDDAIMPHGGTLVDYMGDGIMAVFGAPVEMDDHADRALAAARDKLRELGKFNDWLREEYGFDKSFRMGIGLNTGRVMSGNVGSEQRMAYTAIGDTTNTAARLEAMTKGTPYMIFMSDSTREALSQEPEDLVYVDEFEVRGREQKVKLWSVAEAASEGELGETFQSVGKGS